MIDDHGRHLDVHEKERVAEIVADLMGRSTNDREPSDAARIHRLRRRARVSQSGYEALVLCMDELGLADQTEAPLDEPVLSHR